MSERVHAFWRRLDRPGHDAARLFQTDTGWTLDGYAAFHEGGSTGLRYRVELASDFATKSATIEGHRSGAPIRHEFRRADDKWWLDGAIAEGLDDLIHLDFGFTPSTNYQQLHHAGLAVGEEADVVAAWFDLGEPALVRLPQRYRRTAEDRYWYSSPTSPYEATLEIAANGFVRLYPDLWEAEPCAASALR